MEHSHETPEMNQEPILVVTEEMRSYVYDMAKWASFLSIVGFVFSGITVVSAFTVSSAMDQRPELVLALGGLGAGGKVMFTVFILLTAFAIFYPSLLLFKYASQAKYGVLYGEQHSLNEAFARLRSLFKYWGIITIIFLSFYVLLIIASVMAGVALQQ